MKRSMLLLLALLCAVAGGVQAEPITVTVDVTRGYTINGHSEIEPRVFGMTAYEGPTLPATLHGQEILRRINLPHLGFSGNINWCAPEQKPVDGAAGILKWYRSDEARRMIRDRLLYGDRYMMGRILPASRALGIEPMVYLKGGPAWAMGPENIPADDDLYAALCVGYVGLLREFDPKLRLFHLDNEPNARYFKDKKTGEDYARRFVKVARALKAQYPDILIGGPVLTWPPAWPPKQAGQSNWYTWEQWTLPLLEIAGKDLDFFDFHHYDFQSSIDRSQFLSTAREEILLISNEMLRRYGKRVPIFISEWGLALKADEYKNPGEHWRRRTLMMAHFLLDTLEEPDKVASTQAHDVGAMVAADQSFRIVETTDTENQTPTYWLYWILRHTRGARLDAVSTGPADLRVFATRNREPGKDIEPEAAVLILNDSDRTREVTLEMPGVPSWLKTPLWERLRHDAATNRMVREAGQGATISLPPRSMVAARVMVPHSVPFSPAARERLEFAAPQILAEWQKPGETVAFTVDVPAEALRGATSARLRVGIQGSVPGDAITLHIGADSYPLLMGAYYQEVALKNLPVAGRNDIALQLQTRDGDHRVRASALSLVLEK